MVALLLISVLFFPHNFFYFQLVEELLTYEMWLMIFIVLTRGDSKP